MHGNTYKRCQTYLLVRMHAGFHGYISRAVIRVIWAVISVCCETKDSSKTFLLLDLVGARIVREYLAVVVVLTGSKKNSSLALRYFHTHCIIGAQADLFQSCSSDIRKPTAREPKLLII